MRLPIKVFDNCFSRFQLPIMSLVVVYCQGIDGINAIDYSGYPDCRPEYLRQLNHLAKLSSKKAVEGNPITIKAPLIKMTKEEIIRQGIALKTPYALTWSCYKGGDKACGVCDSCRIRREAFEKVGVRDPIEYEG